MSSRSEAVLARAAMFELEALEPRRFLSAGDSVVEAIALDVEAGVQFHGDGRGIAICLFFLRCTSGNEIRLWLEVPDGPHASAGGRRTDGCSMTKAKAISSSGPRHGREDSFEHPRKRRLRPDAYRFNDEGGDRLEAAKPFGRSGEVLGHIGDATQEDWFSLKPIPPMSIDCERICWMGM